MSRAFIRAADLSDIPGIWSLCSTYFDEYRGSTLKDFHDLCLYRWRDNPARTDAHPFGWILETGERKIVGFLGLVPMRVQVGDRVVTAASGTSWVVDVAYRSYGLDLYKKYMSWGDRYLLLDTTAGPIASQFHQRLKMGMEPIPRESSQKLIWILNPVRYLIRKIWRTFMRNAEKGLPSVEEVEQVFAFTEEFDVFWNEMRSELGVTVVRDRAYLTWRFLKKPKLSGRSFVFTNKNEKGDLLGYLVLQQGGYMNRPSDHFVITDMVFRKSEGPAFQLFLKALSFVKEKKGTVLEASNFHPRLMEELKRLQPRVTQIPHCTYWFKAPSEELRDELREKLWWTSNADGDLNL